MAESHPPLADTGDVHRADGGVDDSLDLLGHSSGQRARTCRKTRECWVRAWRFASSARPQSQATPQQTRDSLATELVSDTSVLACVFVDLRAFPLIRTGSMVRDNRKLPDWMEGLQQNPPKTGVLEKIEDMKTNGFKQGGGAAVAGFGKLLFLRALGHPEPGHKNQRVVGLRLHGTLPRCAGPGIQGQGRAAHQTRRGHERRGGARAQRAGDRGVLDLDAILESAPPGGTRAIGLARRARP